MTTTRDIESITDETTLEEMVSFYSWKIWEKMRSIAKKNSQGFIGL
jgi:hypothetical protein